MATAVHRRYLPYLLGVALAATAVVLAQKGWGFYRLSLEDRVEHPAYRSLRPSGLVGNGYGFVAAGLMVLNLAYLIRRRFGGAWAGSMRAWLDLHVFTGLLAAVLVSFHSAFQLRTPIAMASAASLAMVVLTGVLGRFLHALAPGADRERLRHALDGVDAVFPGRRGELERALAELPGPRIAADASLVRSVLAIPRWLSVARRRRGAIALLLPPARDRRGRAAVRELRRAASADARAAGVSALVRSWRGLHRFFALLMLIAVGLHAGVAWHYGYRWIFT
jgi:hypothetical protein